MARRIWIVSKDTKITQEVIDQALACGCPEIIQGIPPTLAGIIKENSLPMAYEEVIPKPSLPAKGELELKVEKIEADIQAIKTKIGIE